MCPSPAPGGWHTSQESCPTGHIQGRVSPAKEEVMMSSATPGITRRHLLGVGISLPLLQQDGRAQAARTPVRAMRPIRAMDPETIRSGLRSHDRALFLKTGWIRDPYIVLGPDDFYYLTGTTALPGEPREPREPYNTGLRDRSMVGWKVRVWRSKDLIRWDSLGAPYSIKDGIWYREQRERFVAVPESE